MHVLSNRLLIPQRPGVSSTAKIPTVPRQAKDYEKYYIPKVVSIGPYHFGKPQLEFVEKIKPVFTMRLLLDKRLLQSLFNRLGEASMVQKLRSFYEEKPGDMYSDKDFTRVMLLDGCFILYYILYIFGGKLENCGELERFQIAFIHQHLFLLANQIPFKVLNEVMRLIKPDYRKIELFINDNILASNRPNRWWFSFRNDQYSIGKALRDSNEPDHLLHLLHGRLNNNRKIPTNALNQISNYRCTFPPAYELKEAGIHFKPSMMMSLARIEFS